MVSFFITRWNGLFINLQFVGLVIVVLFLLWCVYIDGAVVNFEFS